MRWYSLLGQLLKMALFLGFRYIHCKRVRISLIQIYERVGNSGIKCLMFSCYILFINFIREGLETDAVFLSRYVRGRIKGIQKGYSSFSATKR